MKVSASVFLLASAFVGLVFAAEPAPREVPPIRLNLDRKETVAQKEVLEFGINEAAQKSLKIALGVNAKEFAVKLMEGSEILGMGDSVLYRIETSEPLEVEIKLGKDGPKPCFYILTYCFLPDTRIPAKVAPGRKVKMTSQQIAEVSIPKLKKKTALLMKQMATNKNSIEQIDQMNKRLNEQTQAFMNYRKEKIASGDSSIGAMSLEERRYITEKSNLLSEASKHRSLRVVSNNSVEKVIKEIELEVQAAEDYLTAMNELAEKFTITLKATANVNGTETVIAQTKEPAK